MGLLIGNGVVGLELDTGFIRAVEVQGNGKVAASGHVQIPETAVVDGVVQDVDAVSNALIALWAKAKFRSRSVVLGIFNQGVIMRLINFPKVPGDKLDQALRLQAGDYFPIPLSQMILDFAVVGQVEVDGQEQHEILLVAARKSQLEAGLAALQKSSLKPQVVDATPLALMRVLPKGKLNGTTVVVDLAMGLSSILLATDGMPRFSRVMPVSLKQYIGTVGTTLADDRDYHQYAAAALENEAGWDLFQKWGMTVANEIRTSISFYVKQDSLNEVERIVLSGIGSRVTGLTGLLQEELAVPVELVQPLAHSSAASMMDVDVNLPEFAVSMGLALRGLEV